MRKLRDERGLTAEALAHAMSDLGVPWQRDVVANIENGRRTGITVDELLALAVALEVTPAALLFDLEAESAEIAAGVQATPAEALMWTWGMGALPGLTTARPDEAEQLRRVWLEWLNLDQQHRLAAGRRIDGDQMTPELQAAQRRLIEQVEKVDDKVNLPRWITDYVADLADEAVD